MKCWNWGYIRVRIWYHIVSPPPRNRVIRLFDALLTGLILPAFLISEGIYLSMLSRSRHKPDEVGSTGAAGDEIGASGTERDIAVVDDGFHLHTNRRPNVWSYRWNKWVIRKPSPEMVEALVKSIEFVGKHPWAKWSLMLTYTVFIWPILRGRRR